MELRSTDEKGTNKDFSEKEASMEKTRNKKAF